MSTLSSPRAISPSPEGQTASGKFRKCDAPVTSRKLPAQEGVGVTPLFVPPPPLPPGPLSRCPHGVMSPPQPWNSQHSHVLGFFGGEAATFHLLRGKGAIQGAHGRSLKKLQQFLPFLAPKSPACPVQRPPGLIQGYYGMHISLMNSSGVLGANPIDPTLQNLREEGK